MSQENAEIVRGIYNAWARHEFPGPPEVLDAEIEYVNPAGAVEPGIRHGGRVVRFEWFHGSDEALEAIELRD
jgi:ketosteroid isomerase-like protein